MRHDDTYPPKNNDRYTTAFAVGHVSNDYEVRINVFVSFYQNIFHTAEINGT